MDLVALRNSIPILELATRLNIPVVNNRARCLKPDRHSHGDRTPSLTFNPERNQFKCWVCPDVRGSIIDLVMIAMDKNFKEAIAWLQEQGGNAVFRTPRQVAGVSPAPIPERPGKELLSAERRSEIYAGLFRISDEVNPEAFQYLKGRRIFIKTVKKMGLRSISHYQETARRLEDAFSQEELLASGLFNAKGHFRFFKHTLLMPYFQGGKVCFFQARAIDPEVTPKEMNPTGTIPIPYNIDAVKSNPIIYLCEGVIDTLTLLEQGFAAVGIPGAQNFKPEWVSLFKGRRVCSAFDADKAGRAGNERVRALFAEQGLPFDTVPIPEGHDINDMFTGKAWNPKK